MALTWLDMAAVGAPNSTGVLAKLPTFNAPRPLPPITMAQHSAPPFTFPGAVDILNAAPPFPANGDDDNEYDEDMDSDYGDEDNRHDFLCMLAEKTDCDAMRRKIQRFLARKVITQTAWLKQMEVNSNSYRTFMSYKGKHKGINSCMYDEALLFFHKLEKREGASVVSKGAAKPKVPSVLAAKTAKSAKSTSTSSEPKAPRKEQNAKTQALLDKVNAVTLEEPVLVFDDCDEIRKKIHELIESKTMTQAALLRQLDVNSNSLRRYLTSKGKREGCSNGVYFRAYCFFEKLRIAQGEEKTNKRIRTQIEKPDGYSLQRDPTHTICFIGSR